MNSSKWIMNSPKVDNGIELHTLGSHKTTAIVAVRLIENLTGKNNKWNIQNKKIG